MATLRDLAGGFMGMGGRKRPTTGGIKSPYNPQSATGLFMDNGDAGNPATGGTAAPYGDYSGGGDGGYNYQPPRLPPIKPPPMQYDNTYTGGGGYATTPQTQDPALSNPYTPYTGGAPGAQRPRYSADPPGMAYPGGSKDFDESAGGMYGPQSGDQMYLNKETATGYFNTLPEDQKRAWVDNKVGAYYAGGGTDQWNPATGKYLSSAMPVGDGMGFQPAGVPPGTGGIKPAPGYSPAPYDPSTDPLAQGGSSTASGINFGGLLSSPYTPPPMAMTAPGPGQSGGSDRVRRDHRAEREAMPSRYVNGRGGALTPEAIARQQEALKRLQENPSLARDPGSAFTPGPNQYIDKDGVLQYGYGDSDPRNGGAPLYDDPVNGIKGTLGANPKFNYNSKTYYGAGNAPPPPSPFATGGKYLTAEEIAKYRSGWK